MSTPDLDDIPSNASTAPHFNDVVSRVLSRRGFLKEPVWAPARSASWARA